jgi:hypothetical protein
VPDRPEAIFTDGLMRTFEESCAVDRVDLRMAVAAALAVPILALGIGLGVHFEDGPLGVVVFIVIGALWSLAFAGFGYAIALNTGNPAAVNSTFLLFFPFPFLFLTSAYVPRDQLSGWLNTVADFNPVTYLLAGLRSIVMGSGWQWGQLGQALLALAIVGAISMSLCFAALRAGSKAGSSPTTGWLRCGHSVCGHSVCGHSVCGHGPPFDGGEPLFRIRVDAPAPDHLGHDADTQAALVILDGRRAPDLDARGVHGSVEARSSMTMVARGFSFRWRKRTVLVRSMPPLTMASPSRPKLTAEMSGCPEADAVATLLVLAG